MWVPTLLSHIMSLKNYAYRILSVTSLSGIELIYQAHHFSHKIYCHSFVLFVLGEFHQLVSQNYMKGMLVGIQHLLYRVCYRQNRSAPKSNWCWEISTLKFMLVDKNFKLGLWLVNCTVFTQAYVSFIGCFVLHTNINLKKFDYLLYWTNNPSARISYSPKTSCWEDTVQN